MAFTINGTTVAEPAHKGLVVTEETIWSSNTGRSASGKMIGDIIARKRTVEVTWNTLSYSQAKTIADTLRSAPKFFNITYPDIEAGINSNGTLKTNTIKVYASNVPRELYSLAAGIRYYNGLKVTFIEQ